ncbi:hypothetical protein [Mycobacterium paraseoulense]|nr:hypothetical protein [Mycobacterium paraseoulense]
MCGKLGGDRQRAGDGLVGAFSCNGQVVCLRFLIGRGLTPIG